MEGGGVKMKAHTGSQSSSFFRIIVTFISFPGECDMLTCSDVMASFVDTLTMSPGSPSVTRKFVSTVPK